MQPALGTIGDFFGKTRLMNISLAAVVTTTLVCAFASNFSLLVAMRIIAGMCAGGIFPVGVAIVGDLVPVHARQVAIGRLLGGGADRQSDRRRDLAARSAICSAGAACSSRSAASARSLR